MPKFDPDWFDIVSIFSREGKNGLVSIHAFKQPYTCKQFFIDEKLLESPTFWEDVHKIAMEYWNEPVIPPRKEPPCPRCGTNRRNWQRWYQGRSFCGFCGKDIPGAPQKGKSFG